MFAASMSETQRTIHVPQRHADRTRQLILWLHSLEPWFSLRQGNGIRSLLGGMPRPLKNVSLMSSADIKRHLAVPTRLTDCDRIIILRSRSKHI